MTQQLRFEVFKEVSDHVNWNKYIDYIKQNPEFNDEKRELLIEIYSFLKVELGKDYIEKSHSDGRNLVNHWITTKGYHYSELRWLYNSLSYFKIKNSNYNKILGHIRSDRKCNSEGLPFLIAGDSLRKAGFEIIFEPDVAYSRKPDMKIINSQNGEVIYCEISRLNESDSRAENSFTYHGLMNIFMYNPPTIPFAGKVFKSCTTEELMKLNDIILEKKEKAYKDNSFLEIGLNETYNIIECGIAHPDKIREIEEWENQRKYSGIGNIKGLPLDFNETPRIGTKIEKEAKQLPKDHLGIIYLPVTPMYFLFGTIGFSEITDQIKRVLKKTPHIIGVCVYSHMGNESEPLSFIEFDFFQRKMIHENTQQDFLFVFNHDCNIKVSPDTILRLYNSFWDIYE